MLLGHEDAVKEFMKLNQIGVNIALSELIGCGKINFIEFSKYYVTQLTDRHYRDHQAIASLGLMLASYCFKDESEGGKNARKHLYNSGAFTGSEFGNKLEAEFGNKEEQG